MNDTQDFSYFTPKQIADTDIAILKAEWKSYMSEEKRFSGQKMGIGKGIVITAGGLKYFTSAYVLIATLRELGCTMSIEVWFHGDEMTRAMRTHLKKFGVKCCNMKKFTDDQPHGFLMKPLSIMYSSFREVLFLDADNVCVKDPTYLFEDKNYKEYGCMFWPDYWQTSKNNPIWSILGLQFQYLYEQDSGQMIIDKNKSWDQLQLCIYFNLKGDDYYKFIYGDKDTFRFAWLALKKDYYMVTHDVGSCGVSDDDSIFYGNTMVQHDSLGNIIFLHRNLLKWDTTLKSEYAWERIKRFSTNAIHKYCRLKSSTRHHNSIDLEGDTYEVLFNEFFPGFEKKCLTALNKIRSSRFYRNELMEFYLSINRFSK